MSLGPWSARKGTLRIYMDRRRERKQLVLARNVGVVRVNTDNVHGSQPPGTAGDAPRGAAQHDPRHGTVPSPPHAATRRLRTGRPQTADRRTHKGIHGRPTTIESPTTMGCSRALRRRTESTIPGRRCAVAFLSLPIRLPSMPRQALPRSLPFFPPSFPPHPFFSNGSSPFSS